MNDKSPDKKVAEDAKSEAQPKVDPKSFDLGALDLSVEKVEERISPSETNVFDK
jgi:hypothetical protein